MLSFLSIQNYALIRQLNMDFKDGFSVITGETGAGKSILLGALNLILGKRADTQILLDKSKKCIVEGTFQIGYYNLQEFFRKYNLDYDKNAILRREINTYGKSRAFINDSPVNLSVLKELGDKLIDIHSQRQTITLNDTNFQLAVIDSYGGITDKINKYRTQYLKLIELQNDFHQLINKEKQSGSEQDYYQFLFNELDEAKIRDGEQEELEKELEILNHSEEIKSNLFSSARVLGNDENSLLNNLSGVLNNISNLSKFSDTLKELSERLSSSYIELTDIFTEIEKVEQSIIHDPVKLAEINDRLDFIYGLQKKHRVNSVNELLLIKEDINTRLKNFSSLESQIKSLKSEVKKLETEVIRKAENISVKRRNVFSDIEKEIENSLILLGIPDARFQINHKLLNEAGKDGIDKVKFLFNANRGEELQELSKVASGGEISRLMLAVKSLISQKNLLPTVIFDEIDIGVSGAIADKVGNILLKLSGSMQVVAITHLPQIAGKGDTHYLVYKKTAATKTKSEIKQLTPDERIIEIAKMLSGQAVTSASVETAKQLLNN
ncbi:MAG: DNA repair protein RecN [Bacteroidales bacterium]|nr:DNA repair protein RecN [Bacteroidales bacterium]